MTEPLEILKIVIIFCLFFGSILCCLVPWGIKKLKLGRKTNFIFSVLNCFCAGIILGAGFLLLLHDSNENFENYINAKNSVEPPHSHDPHEPHESHDDPHEPHDEHSDEPHEPHDEHSDEPHDPHNGDLEEPHTHEGHMFPYGPLCACLSLLLLISVESILLKNSSFAAHNHATADFKLDNKSVEMVTSTPDMMESLNPENEQRKTSIVHAIVFTFALSLHSFFEGLGMGSESSKTTLTGILIAVVIHKILEAIALGLSIFRCKMVALKNALLITIYSLATPLGMIISMSINTDTTTKYLLAGIFNGIAAGSFVYIALVELIPSELSKKSSTAGTLLRLFVIFAGLAVISGIATKHNH